MCVGRGGVDTYGRHDEGDGEDDGGEDEHTDGADDGDLQELLGGSSGVESGAEVWVSGFLLEARGAALEEDVGVGFAVEDQAYDACCSGLGDC